jgi:nucleotide-binding universal stress UspA family protein
MSLREVLAIVISRREDEPAIAAAERMEKALGTRISVLEFYKAADQATAWTLRQDEPDWSDGDLAVKTRPRAVSESARLKRRLERFTRPVSIKRLQMLDGAGADWAGIEARRASLAIMMRPAGLSSEPFRRAMFESALYESGRPVLLMPPERRSKAIGRNIVVAWDGSRAASRALADAEDLLFQADFVSVVTIDTGARDGLPGHDVAAYLRRNGLRCQQRAIPGARHEVEALLIAECEAVDADMIVMGGYGHARLHEMLFGGVTRALVKGAPLPLFISR